MKKLTAILMAMVLMLSMSVTGNAETVVYKGMAKFMISEQHMIEGTIELEEDIPHTFYQKSCWKSPRGTKGDGTIIRDKVMSMADIAGYTEMYAQIDICDEWLPLVRTVIGEETEITVNTLIEATVYHLEEYAAHVCFTSRDAFTQIGKVTFKDGNWCFIYAGIWEGDTVTRLGFRAGYYQIVVTPEPTPEPTPAPVPTCRPTKRPCTGKNNGQQTNMTSLFSININQDNSQTFGFINVIQKSFEIFKSTYQQTVVNKQPCKK